MRMPLALAALLSVALAGHAESAPPFRHLRPKPGVVFTVSQDGNGYTHGGQVAVPGNRLSQLVPENVSTYFEPVRTPEQALELCLLLHWGALLEDAKAFDVLVALQPGKTPTRKPRRFDVVTESLKGGFDVAFTLLQMDPQMGAGSRIARYRYRVDGGSVRRMEETIYLEGPGLNWQVELEADGDAAQAHKDLESREACRNAFLDRAFALGKPVPAGFNPGLPRPAE